MSIKFVTGNRHTILNLACIYAIRDQEALVDALTTNHWEKISSDTQQAIDDANFLIKDLQKLKKSLEAKS